MSTVTAPTNSGELKLGRHRSDVLAATGIYVSTIVRESSADYGSPYFETMAFWCDPTAHGSHAILWQSAAGYRRAADRQHDLAVRWFSRPWR